MALPIPSDFSNSARHPLSSSCSLTSLAVVPRDLCSSLPPPRRRSPSSLTIVKTSSFKTSVGYCSRPQDLQDASRLQPRLKTAGLQEASRSKTSVGYCSSPCSRLPAFKTLQVQDLSGIRLKTLQALKPRLKGAGLQDASRSKTSVGYCSRRQDQAIKPGESFFSRGWVRVLLHPRAPLPWALGLVRAHLTLPTICARQLNARLKKLLSFFLFS
ncbi:hypothetical protein B0H19DRAFT_456998 [Mycena capillaripes]|nr:hypothetical protein B0H19DRAFT_456998 [Mycena capillaripes]